MKTRYYYPIATTLVLGITNLMENNYLSLNVNKVIDIIILFLILLSYIYLSYGIYKQDKLSGDKHPRRIFISTLIILIVIIVSFCTIML